jgi:CcmD family protein
VTALFWTYMLIWAALFGYLLRLSVKLSRVEQDIQSIRGRLETKSNTGEKS